MPEQESYNQLINLLTNIRAYVDADYENFIKDLEESVKSIWEEHIKGVIQKLPRSFDLESYDLYQEYINEYNEYMHKKYSPQSEDFTKYTICSTLLKKLRETQDPLIEKELESKDYMPIYLHKIY